jgi:hypothetical protein
LKELRGESDKDIRTRQRFGTLKELRGESDIDIRTETEIWHLEGIERRE